MKNVNYVLGVFILSLVVTGCSSDYDTRAYYEIPYGYSRTAGSGVEYYLGDRPSYAAVEPAAGPQESRAERIFRERIKK